MGPGKRLLINPGDPMLRAGYTYRFRRRVLAIVERIIQKSNGVLIFEVDGATRYCDFSRKNLRRLDRLQREKKARLVGVFRVTQAVNTREDIFALVADEMKEVEVV